MLAFIAAANLDRAATAGLALVAVGALATRCVLSLGETRAGLGPWPWPWPRPGSRER